MHSWEGVAKRSMKLMMHITMLLAICFLQKSSIRKKLIMQHA